MSGTYRRLPAGQYELEVGRGEGPAGVRREDGRDVVIGLQGGRVQLTLERSERVYYWWRGPSPRAGVQLRRMEARVPAEELGTLSA